ncbi:hypothetical protein CYFUS_009238 [Cystobacter fuscus]|uniref:Uncharacterized protein n=1 Tax=Cystobacter fuscus TaxID=43 RepID=A0A250JJG1_9BACT|nr:hypothetical protein CYFUS_009238 [Cystobacter fuscus]
MLLAPTVHPRDAAAQDDISLVAVHPCVVIGEKDKKKAQHYEAACSAALARTGVKHVPDEQVSAFLEKEPKKSCVIANKESLDCLGRLAANTQSGHSLLVTVKPGVPTFVSGHVVDTQGQELRKMTLRLSDPEQLLKEDEGAEDIRNRPFALRLLRQLRILPRSSPPRAEPPPTPPAAEAPAPTTPPVAAAPPPVVAEEMVLVPSVRDASSRGWKKPVAYTAAGVGVAALGLAGFLVLDGDKAMRDSNAYYADGRYPTSNDVSQIVALREKAASRRVLSGVSAAVGAALAGAGVYLWLQDRPAAAAPTPGVASLSVGPGGVSILGVLP